MSDDREYSTGELYRLCERIETKVDTTNGRVTALEKDAVRIKTLWSVAAIAVGFFADSIRHKLGL